MKTSLAIVLAVAALTIGTATVSPISSTAIAGGGGPDRWCGAAVCPQQNSPTGASCASWVVSDRHISRSLKSEAGWQSCGGSRCCDR